MFAPQLQFYQPDTFGLAIDAGNFDNVKSRFQIAYIDGGLGAAAFECRF